MFISIIRKIELYLELIYQYANNEYWEMSQGVKLILLEDEIRYVLESYPKIVLDYFDEFLSIKAEMDSVEDSSLIYDIESFAEEMLCLIKEYECMSEYSDDEENFLSDYNWNPQSELVLSDDTDDYLVQYNLSEAKLKLATDIEHANMICQFIKDSKGLVAREKILVKFKNISVRALNIALSRDEILSYDSVYIAADNINVTKSAKEKMRHTLLALTKDKEQHHISELMDAAINNNNDFLMEAKISNTHQLFSVIAYYFKNDFCFSRPYFSDRNVEILNATDQLKQYLIDNKDYSIRSLLDFAKNKKISVDNIVRILNSVNDYFYILDKENVIPVNSLGIDESCKKQIVNIIIKELREQKCVAIRDLTCIAALPKINSPWTEWLVYSVLKQMQIPTLSLILSSSRFKDAIPIVALAGEDTAENIHEATLNLFDTSDELIKVDNLENLDILLEEIIDFNLLEDVL